MSRPVTGAASERTHCCRCGRRCVTGDSPAPECPVHGPQWEYIRNAPCAAVIVTAPDGRIALGRRVIEPWSGWWEIPGGFSDLGEHPADTAVREAREELGLDVVLDALVGVYLHGVPGDASGAEWRQVTLYTGRSGGELRPDPTEVSEAAWFDPAALPGDTSPDHRRRIEDLAAGRTPLQVGR